MMTDWTWTWIPEKMSTGICFKAAKLQKLTYWIPQCFLYCLFLVAVWLSVQGQGFLLGFCTKSDDGRIPGHDQRTDPTALDGSVKTATIVTNLSWKNLRVFTSPAYRTDSKCKGKFITNFKIFFSYQKIHLSWQMDEWIFHSPACSHLQKAHWIQYPAKYILGITPLGFQTGQWFEPWARPIFFLTNAFQLLFEVSTCYLLETKMGLHWLRHV